MQDVNKMIRVMCHALSNNLEGLWEEIFKSINDDVLARNVEDIAAAEGWGRERLATVLAAILLTRVIQQQAEILRLAQMQPPPPILVPKDQIVYLPSPPSNIQSVDTGDAKMLVPKWDFEHRGPGC